MRDLDFDFSRLLVLNGRDMCEVLINYVIKENSLDDNISAIRRLFADLRTMQIDGVNMTVYKLEHVFLHVVQYRDEEAERKLDNSYPFQEFVAALQDRLQELPIVNRVTEIERYSCL